MNIAAQINRAHYLFRANSFKTVDSLSELINQNLHLTKDKNIALLNKPPGFILSSNSFNFSKTLFSFLKIREKIIMVLFQFLVKT